MKINATELIQRNQSSFSILFAIAVCWLSMITTIFAAPGDLDPTFGKGGKVITDMPSDTFARQVKVQPDGKIVALCSGKLEGIFRDGYLVRYNPNGTLDLSFGGGGFVYSSWGMQGDFGDGFAILPDGKLLVAGSIQGVLPSEVNLRNSGAFRFNSDGTLDTTWGVNGFVKVPIYGIADALIVKPNGKIIVFVSTYVVRLNADGTLDTTYGTNGVTRIGNPFMGFGNVRQVELQPDGKILFLNRFSNTAQYAVGASIGRLNANDTLDIGFGDYQGFLQIGSSEIYGNTFAVQSDGRIVVATSKTEQRGSAISITSTVARYSANGAALYYAGEEIFTLAPSAGVNFKLTSIIVQPNEKIIVGGTRIAGVSRNFVMLRLNRNLKIDRGFGVDGFAVAALRGVDDFLTGLALQPDGNLIALGEIGLIINEPSYDLGLARFLNNARSQSAQFDFDGDNRSDISVFRPSNGLWRYLNSSNNSISELPWGLSSDKLTPADYDGDGRTDFAVFREGAWHIYSSIRGYFSIQLGRAGDLPVPGDYDGDGRADIAVFRAGVWHIRQSSNNQTRVEQFGLASDKPVLGDFDGDGKNDLAVYRDGIWFVQGSQAGFFARQFGLPSDKPAAADYDADGKTDFAVFREGVWYLLQSSAGFAAMQFGLATDTPVPADYDGDGRADIAVFRDGFWYIQQSASNSFRAVQFGVTSDMPIPAAYQP